MTFARRGKFRAAVQYSRRSGAYTHFMGRIIPVVLAGVTLVGATAGVLGQTAQLPTAEDIRAAYDAADYRKALQLLNQALNHKPPKNQPGPEYDRYALNML